MRSDIKTLEGAPLIFGTLLSDLGEFKSWDDIPDALAPATKPLVRAELTRIDREKEAVLEKEVAAVTVLQAPIKVTHALKIKPRGPKGRGQ